MAYNFSEQKASGNIMQGEHQTQHNSRGGEGGHVTVNFASSPESHSASQSGRTSPNIANELINKETEKDVYVLGQLVSFFRKRQDNKGPSSKNEEVYNKFLQKHNAELVYVDSKQTYEFYINDNIEPLNYKEAMKAILEVVKSLKSAAQTTSLRAETVPSLVAEKPVSSPSAILNAYQSGISSSSSSNTSSIPPTRGDANAPYAPGVMYAYGDSVDKDLKLVAEWARRAAEQGDAQAQSELGYAYATGQGVPQDLKLAAEWTRKAAEQGVAAAQYALGVMYDKGDGITKDAKKAGEWYQKAAEQWHANAQYRLGEMYENGEGVSKDMQIACRWYEKAANNGNEYSRIAIKRLIDKGLFLTRAASCYD